LRTVNWKGFCLNDRVLVASSRCQCDRLWKQIRKKCSVRRPNFCSAVAGYDVVQFVRVACRALTKLAARTAACGSGGNVIYGRVSNHGCGAGRMMIAIGRERQ
jgi:hypothetical protein